ncbi:hypothetical protein [Halovenus salina]|uniref:Uncharacterized protein n=1 Tax=Halovenus salina TaxID=1510225 RepID=A0ABD5VZV7_9EURY|nr:hypothetical protein [Halovenus salina]
MPGHAQFGTGEFGHGGLNAHLDVAINIDRLKNCVDEIDEVDGVVAANDHQASSVVEISETVSTLVEEDTQSKYE